MNLKTQFIKIPKSPGVYFFKNRKGEVLYIGKAVSLRDRVRSYFGPDLEKTRSSWIARMREEIDDVDFEKTDSTLEALLLEARLIKKHKPPFNSREKDDKSFSYVLITKEELPVVGLIRERELYKNKDKIKPLHIFGPFPQGGLLKEALKIIRKIFPFRDEKCMPAYLQKSRTPKPCFNWQIELCPGTCVGEISAREYGKLIGHLSLFFQGKKGQLIRKLEKERDIYSKKQEFEKAGETQRRIKALEHIRDISLLKDFDFEDSRSNLRREEKEAPKTSYRIEGYDIAHTSGAFVVGAFSVVEGGKLKKSDYRKFKIKEKPGIDDTKALKEVIRRRMSHEDWELPNLVVVDGGVAQKNAVTLALREAGRSIQVVAVTKDKNHRPHRYHGDKKIIDLYKKEIVSANMEAHRFALFYHRSLREKMR